jgi:putative SOS response-associated peptidase YedK
MSRPVLEKNYGKLISGSPRPKFNISQGTRTPLRCKGDDFLVWSKWGLIPYDSKTTGGFEALDLLDLSDPQIKSKYNIRSAQKCIIPVNGFYLWNDQESPVYIQFKRNPHFAFAGLYESWEISQGKQVHTFLIFQMPSTGKVNGISKLMPLVMSSLESRIWLENDDLEIFHSEILNEEENMTVQPANRDVIDKNKDHKDLIKSGKQAEAGENLSLF